MMQYILLDTHCTVERNVCTCPSNYMMSNHKGILLGLLDCEDEGTRTLQNGWTTCPVSQHYILQDWTLYGPFRMVGLLVQCPSITSYKIGHFMSLSQGFHPALILHADLWQGSLRLFLPSSFSCL